MFTQVWKVSDRKKKRFNLLASLCCHIPLIGKLSFLVKNYLLNTSVINLNQISISLYFFFQKFCHYHSRTSRAQAGITAYHLFYKFIEGLHLPSSSLLCLHGLYAKSTSSDDCSRLTRKKRLGMLVLSVSKRGCIAGSQLICAFRLSLPYMDLFPTVTPSCRKAIWQLSASSNTWVIKIHI